MMPARDPAGLVEQPDGRAVVQPEPFGPGQGPQRQGQRLGLAHLPGLRDQRLGGGAEPVRVARHGVIHLPRAYHEVVRRLCPCQEAVQCAGPGPVGPSVVRLIVI